MTGPHGHADVSNLVVTGAVGAVLQAETIYLQGSGSPSARSSYLAQVERFAPRNRLVSRVHELRTLEKFANGAGKSDYLVWEAPPWAGKTALLSWFVLHPPPRVRVFAFFVTGRSAGHDDRIGFLDVVLEQFAEFLGEPVPQVEGATREVRFRGVLEEVARRCAAAGERPLLVVDGLDEDRGVSSSDAVHSIAALLPVAPVGMRVVVATRPSPPVPTDVPEHHPLRSRAAVRPLRQSTRARVVQHDMQRELDRLIEGTQDERDLLGFITVSGGGLTAADLAHLGGWSVRRSERMLESVTGRTFLSRELRWLLPGVAHMFGHVELQRHAERFLGPAQIAHYWGRVERWADTYRCSRWPSSTPEFFVETYPRLLDKADDRAGLVALALDPDRHDWLRFVTGSDATALAEIARAGTVVDPAAPDGWSTLVKLAYHRDRLVERTEHVPVDVPALWAELGKLERAEVLLATMRPPDHRAHAIARMVEVLPKRAFAGAGGHLVRTLLDLSRGMANPHRRAVLLRRVAEALARVGENRLALAAVRSIPQPSWMELAELRLVEIAAARRSTAAVDAFAGELAESAAATRDGAGTSAEEIIAAKAAAVRAAMSNLVEGVGLCGRLPLPHQIDALVRVAGATARHGDVAAVRAVIDFIRTRASRLGNRRVRAHRLVDVIRLENLTVCPRDVGHLVEAVAAAIATFDAGVAEELAVSLGRALARGCGTAAAASFFDAVEALQARVDLPPELIMSVGSVVSIERATELVKRSRCQDGGLDGQIAVGRVLCAARRTDEAERLLESVLARPAVTKKGFAAHVVGAMVAAEVTRGDLAAARARLDSLPGTISRDRELQSLIAGYSTCGQFEMATALCGLLHSRSERQNAMLRIMTDRVVRGDTAATDEITSANGEAAVVLVKELIAAGDTTRAGTITDRITDHNTRLRALAVLITATPDDAVALVGEARGHLVNPDITLADKTLIDVAAAVVSHDVDLAKVALGRIAALDRRVAAMAKVAAAAATSGRRDLVAEYANSAQAVVARHQFKRAVRDNVLCSVAHLVALAGDLARAEAYLRHIKGVERVVHAHLTLAEVASSARDAGRSENFLQRAMSTALVQTPRLRHELLKTVIEATVRIRRQPATAHLLDLVTAPRDRISLMVELADVLPAATATLLANALREGHLDLSIAAVATRDPDVWIALAEEAAKVADARS